MTSGPPFEDRVGDWLREGPTDAPDPLLETVLTALPTTRQRRGLSRLYWRIAPMNGFSRVLAAVVIVVAVGAAALFAITRPGPGGVGATGSQPAVVATASSSATPSAEPSSSPSAAPTSSPSPTPNATSSPPPTATPSHAPALCAAADLAARITLWEGAAGHRIAHVEMTDKGSGSCLIRKVDQPQLVDGHGSVLIDGVPPTSTSTLTITPGAVVKTLVQDANYCGPDPVAPVTVAFIIGTGGRIVATPVSPTDVTVPPCNGGTGSAGDIQMQDWAP